MAPANTVEIEANGDSKSTNERGPSMVGSCQIRDFCSALAAPVGTVEKKFFPAVHYFNSFVPIA